MTVTVIMSTYNGEKNVVRQMESIFAQKGVDVNLCVRDDGSSDQTVAIIVDYQNKHPDYNIKLIQGVNEGYAKSFWDALKDATEADYYAFSDQDDVWKEDKLIKCISAINNTSIVPALAYCRMNRCDEQLNELDEQIKVLQVDELNKKLALTQTYNYGAATVFNEAARQLICRCWPEVDDFPHDLWAGMLCCWFGKVYFVDEALYYWIRYDSSVTGEGTRKSGIMYRLRKTLQGLSYPNVSQYLLEYYEDLLEKKDTDFLKDLCIYKKNLRAKVRILKDRDFKRSTRKGTFILKLGVLLGWF